MSISTQPAARHTSLQRVLSARLHVPSTMDMTASSTDPADKMQRPRVTTMDEASWPQPLSNCAAQTYSNDSSLSCLPQAQLPAQGLLPAIASELASQLQAKKRASFSCQPTCSSGTGQAHCTAADVPEATTSDPLKHNSKRVRLSPVTNIDVRLAQQAACLEEELAAMKAGAAVISDKAAWVAAARHTAHQVPDSYAQASAPSKQVASKSLHSSWFLVCTVHTACQPVPLVAQAIRVAHIAIGCAMSCSMTGSHAINKKA